MFSITFCQNGSCSSPALTSAEPTDDSSDSNGKHSSCKSTFNILIEFESCHSNVYLKTHLASYIKCTHMFYQTS